MCHNLWLNHEFCCCWRIECLSSYIILLQILNKSLIQGLNGTVDCNFKLSIFLFADFHYWAFEEKNFQFCLPYFKNMSIFTIQSSIIFEFQIFFYIWLFFLNYRLKPIIQNKPINKPVLCQHITLCNVWECSPISYASLQTPRKTLKIITYS